VTDPKLLSNLYMLADLATSEAVRGRASAARAHGPVDGAAAALVVAAAEQFAAAGAAYLASIAAAN
jgi:hypothetical protein